MKKLTKGAILKNSAGWQQGMTLLNAAGDVDVSTLGYQYTIQTVTQIRAKTIVQKFYRVAPADYMSVVIGTGAWMEEIKTNLTYDVAGPFESGIISVANAPAQLGQVDVGVAPINTKIITWAKGYQYSTPEIQKALASNNWDVVSSKMEALKRNWDLGLQKIAFLGLLGDLTNTPGLLTNASVTSNLSVITAKISGLSSANFQTFVSQILAAYVQNCSYTVLPNTFLMPMDDYLGLGVAASGQFPVNSMLDYLLNMFRQITQNPNFQIKPLAYGNPAQNAGYVATNGKNRYVLYNNDPDTLWLDVPVDFALTPAGTRNNFNWEGVGAGQFTGVTIARPAEVLYFDF